MDPRDAANRDLLIGLLALQIGMVEQDLLVAAFRSWTRDKTRPIVEILAAQGAIDVDDRALLEGLARKHLTRHGGDAEWSLAALNAGPSTLESLAGIGDPDIGATLGHVGSGPVPGVAGRTVSYQVGGVAPDGARFRVLRPHARGGLGEVFVALDEELHREVALKQILDHHADDPNSRTRFVMEAEITGGLEHPGIVPVYGLGSYGDGRPYYAMRFVRGDSLKEAVAAFHADGSLKADPGKRSLALRKLLRRFVDVCNAIDYAHTRGVLHRDIKPANVIVGKHGETLVVDWGLAKVMGRPEAGSTSGQCTLMPSSASGSAETLPGSAMGTPAYMSPEQASGDLDRLGVRSDVYSLGATLYCLLTGRPPFEGDDLGAVLRAVQKGDFPKPRAADPSIDPALDGVCLKAMALKPEDRYPTPKALADDVERWAADEPVSAWREPLARRARRWGRRNRTAVTAGAVAVLALLFGTAAVLAVQTQANSVLKRANLALADANARTTKANADLSRANSALAGAKDREAARFGLAMEAIKLFHGEVGDDLVLKADQFKPLRDKLLKGAADFYGKLEGLLKGQTDRASRRAMGNAYFELGELTAKIGDKPAALAVHHKGLVTRRALASGPATDSEARSDVANSLLAIGWLLFETSNLAEALARSEEARDLLESQPLVGPGSDGRRDLLGRAYNRIANVLAATGKTDAAMSAYERSVEILARLVDDNPDVTLFRINLAGSHLNLGMLQFKTGHLAEALESYRRALAIRQKLVDDNPAVTLFRERLAENHYVIGMLQSQAGHPAEALESHRRALAIRQKLADDNPAVTLFRDGLAESHYGIGFEKSNTGHSAEALESYRRALAIQQKLADEHPTVTRFRSRLAIDHHGIGSLQSQDGHPAEALESYRRALAIRQKLADEHPTVTDFRSRLAISHSGIGRLQSQAGHPAEALESYRRALAIQQKLADEHPTVTEFQEDVAEGLLGIGWQFAQAGRNDEAIDYYRREEAIRRKLADARSATFWDLNRLANCQTNTADLLRKSRRTDEARAACERAIALRESLVKDHPQVTFLRGGLAETYLRAGQVQSDAGDPAGAASAWRRAVSLYEGLKSPDGEQTFFRACCHAGLSAIAGRSVSGVTAEEGLAEPDRAMTWLRQAVAVGYRNPDPYRTESALDPLRNRPDFRLLMMDLVFPADPFGL